MCLDARDADDPFRSFDLLAHEARELRRRHRHRLRAKARKALAHLCRGDDPRKIARDLAQIVAMAEVRERLARLGAEPMPMTPAEFARFVRSEIDSAERIVRISGVKAQ